MNPTKKKANPIFFSIHNHKNTYKTKQKNNIIQQQQQNKTKQIPNKHTHTHTHTSPTINTHNNPLLTLTTSHITLISKTHHSHYNTTSPIRRCYILIILLFNPFIRIISSAASTSIIL